MVRKIKIADKVVGEGEPCFIIAEAGVNHNGDVNLAKKLIDAAKEAGADAVKFQTFKVEETVTTEAPKAKYQRNSRTPSESQYQMLKNMELSLEEWQELSTFARKANIIFFSRPCSEEAVDILLELGVPAIKIGSGDVTYYTLLAKAAQTGLPVILSTGLSTLAEVEDAVNVLYSSGNRELVLLHCVSNYPAAYKDVNLRAMLTLRHVFQVPVGFSDHTLGIMVPLAAVALGASVIEKHLTLDKTLPGPDHKASLEPEEFREMVKGIRTVQKALGSPLKKPAEAEIEMRMISRKSIVARTDIPKGTLITQEMLAFKRPGTGLSQKFLEVVIGRRARVDIPKDKLITWEMI